MENLLKIMALMTSKAFLCFRFCTKKLIVVCSVFVFRRLGYFKFSGGLQQGVCDLLEVPGALAQGLIILLFIFN